MVIICLEWASLKQSCGKGYLGLNTESRMRSNGERSHLIFRFLSEGDRKSGKFSDNIFLKLLFPPPRHNFNLNVIKTEKEKLRRWKQWSSLSGDICKIVLLPSKPKETMGGWFFFIVKNNIASHLYGAFFSQILFIDYFQNGTEVDLFLNSVLVTLFLPAAQHPFIMAAGYRELSMRLYFK